MTTLDSLELELKRAVSCLEDEVLGIQPRVIWRKSQFADASLQPHHSLLKGNYYSM